MSIRAMATKYGVTVTADKQDLDAALVFVANREYLIGLKILLYSMAKQNTLLDLPVLVISEDEDLLKDDFINTVGDQFRHVSQTDISPFQHISSAKVPEIVRLDWIPKYTFLKWMIYDEYGYSRLVWIDADILCVGPVDELAIMNEADLYGGPIFPRELTHASDEESAEPLDENTSAARIEHFIAEGYVHQGLLNSGVMSIGEKLLNKSFREALITWAEHHEVSTEQKALRGLIDSRGDLTRCNFSPYFNFNHAYWNRLTTAELEPLRNDVRLLHYVGARSKPWKKSDSMKVESYRLWHSYQREASNVHPVFALNRSSR